MKRVRFFIETGSVSCVHEVVEDFDDDITDEELDEIARDLVWEYISTNWREETGDEG